MCLCISMYVAMYICIYIYSYIRIRLIHRENLLFQLQTVDTTLPYHRIMTPSYLQCHATIFGPYILTPQYLEISPTTGDIFQRALKIQLVAPDILTSTDCVDVTVTIAFDVKLAANDHDPFIGISNGAFVNGFIASDPSFIRPMEGQSGRVLLNSMNAGNAVNVQQFPGEIKMQFKPTDNWGSAYGNDHTIIGYYQHSLDPTKGLYLELYRNSPKEKYHIRYITVDVSSY